jgi:hypothetical protein
VPTATPRLRSVSPLARRGHSITTESGRGGERISHRLRLSSELSAQQQFSIGNRSLAMRLLTPPSDEMYSRTLPSHSGGNLSVRPRGRLERRQRLQERLQLAEHKPPTADHVFTGARDLGHRTERAQVLARTNRVRFLYRRPAFDMACRHNRACAATLGAFLRKRRKIGASIPKTMSSFLPSWWLNYRIVQDARRTPASYV